MNTKSKTLEHKHNSNKLALGRNDPCICGSGVKYKNCCLGKTDASRAAGYLNIAADLQWQKIRQTEGELMQNMRDYFADKMSEERLAIAELLFFANAEFPDQVIDAFFATVYDVWFYFDMPPLIDIGTGTDNMNAKPLAMQYLMSHKKYLSDFQIKFLETACAAYYSYYRVVAIEVGKSITLYDLMLDEEVTIKENKGTYQLEEGGIVLGKIIKIDDQAVSLAIYPYMLLASYGTRIIQMKHYFLEYKDRKKVTPKLLIQEDSMHILRMEYFEMVRSLIAPPILKNSDGDYIEFHELKFEIDMIPEELFDTLFHLTLEEDIEKDGFIKQMQRDKKGKIIKFELPWNKFIKNKAKAKNTLGSVVVMANIIVEKDDSKSNYSFMQIDTNSKKRAKKVEKDLYKLLGERIKSFSVNVISMDELSQKPRSEEDDGFIDSDEMNEIIQQMAKRHWDDWLDEELPALNNMTPKEAVHDKKGLELLEELLLFFETKSNNEGGNTLFNPDVKQLRKRLGLKKK